MQKLKLTLTTREEFFKQVNDMLQHNPKKVFDVTIKQHRKKRSIPANNSYYAWLPKMADALAMIEIEARCYIKLNFGLPILRDGESTEGNILLENLDRVNFFMMPYEDQMKFMLTTPVTSLMVSSQHTKMRDALQYFFGTLGVNLDYERG